MKSASSTISDFGGPAFKTELLRRGGSSLSEEARCFLALAENIPLAFGSEAARFNFRPGFTARFLKDVTY